MKSGDFLFPSWSKGQVKIYRDTTDNTMRYTPAASWRVSLRVCAHTRRHTHTGPSRTPASPQAGCVRKLQPGTGRGRHLSAETGWVGVVGVRSWVPRPARGPPYKRQLKKEEQAAPHPHGLHGDSKSRAILVSHFTP